MKNHYISTDTSLLDCKKVWDLLKDCFWCKDIPIELIQKFINHSLCFGVYQMSDHSLVGFGRVITDYTTYAYICDVIIDRNHRKKGLGHLLIGSIMEHPTLQHLKTWSLRTTEEARKIYEQYGFKIAEHPASQLEINDLAIYTKKLLVAEI